MLNVIILLILLILPGLIAIIGRFFRNLYLWQVKEYRLDRLLSQLRYEQDFRNSGTIIYIFEFALLIIGLSYFYFPGSAILAISYILAFVVFILEAEIFIKDILLGILQRPRLNSARNLIIATFFIGFVFSVYVFMFSFMRNLGIENIDFSTNNEGFFNSSWEPTESITTISLFVIFAAIPLLTSLFLNIFTPFITSFLVLLTAPLSSISRRRTINKAKKKIKRMKDLKVVAITGSYGKSTTKELIYEILQNYYKVAKTPANLNTAVGVSQSVLKNLKPDTELFIAEVGAYKKGEINSVTTIITPDISIVTIVAEQHLSLFGSREKLWSAKYELVEGLSEDGIAVLNGNDDTTIKMGTETERDCVYFFHKPIDDEDLAKIKEINNIRNNNLYVKAIVKGESGFNLDLIYKDVEYKVKTKFIDEKFALNITASMLTCLLLGMNMPEVIRAVEDIKQPSQLPKLKKGNNGSRIIDDSKTSNVAGFKLALDVLEKSPGKRFLFTQGIIELGGERKETYKKLAQGIVKKSDVLVTTDRALAEAVLSQENDFEVIRIERPHQFSRFYKHNVSANDVVLLEGSMPQNVLNQIF